MNLSLATAFVEANGSAAEFARLRFLLSRIPAPADVLDAHFDTQRADGGFAPIWAADYSSLDATCFKIAVAEQLGAARDARTKRAINFIALCQARDGSFSETQRVAGSAPPWAMPGDPAATVYLTANCGFWLTALDPLTGPANSAGRFLHNQLQKGDALPAFAQANWLAAGLWHRLGWAKPFDYACAYLTRRLDTFDAGDLAWMSATLHIAGVPAKNALRRAIAQRLSAMQADDGRWRGADGPERDVHVTLEAMRALI